MGGKLHLRLNIGERPIANKYREGKMKRSLKRELKVLEIAKREANKPSHLVGGTPLRSKRFLMCLLSSVTINSFCRRKPVGRYSPRGCYILWSYYFSD
jgi:hypothetical protein